MSSEVRRASHTHQVPQVGRPQSEPVASARAVSTAPIGAAALAAASASEWRKTRPKKLAPAMQA